MFSLGEYESCTIPAGSYVFPNFWSIMRDPDYWSQPDIFKPERFLHGEEGTFQPDERMVAFGSGARYVRSFFDG